MPITRVLDESTGIMHKFDVPEKATPQEIEAFAAESIAASKKTIGEKQASELKLTENQARAAGAVSSIPFGKDIAATVGTAIYGGAAPDVPFWTKQEQAKRFLDEAAKQGLEQQPGSYLTGAVLGGVPVGMAIPSSVYSGPTALTRLVKSGAVGGTIGALLGGGEGVELKERIPNAIQQGTYGTIGGTILSPVIDVIGTGARAVPGLAKRAMSIFSPNKQPMQNVNIAIEPIGQSTGQQIAQNLKDVAPQAPLSQEIIPLTRGQALQGAPGKIGEAQRMQALEYGAQAGMHGPEAQQLALEARQLQSGAAKNVLESTAGGALTDTIAQETAAQLKNRLSQSYNAAKARTTAAYKTVGELSQDQPLQIAGDYVRDNVVGAVKDWARKGSSGRPWDLSRSDMGEAKKLYNQAASMGDMKKISAVNFFRMEDWRGRVSQAISAAPPGSPSKAFLSGMLDRYDRTMGQLPREAIKNGDEAIIKAMETARGARKEQGVLFERSKLVKDVLLNDDMTQEQLGNTLTSLGPKTGVYIRDMLRTTKDPVEKESLRQDLKKAIIGSVYAKALSSEVMQGSTVAGGIEKMISFDKLATNLDKMMKNQTLVKNVLTKEEAATLENARRAATLIKSIPPGSKNYSNTAYTILNALSGFSTVARTANVAGIGLGSAVESVAKSTAVKELKDSLAPVIQGLKDENGVIINLGNKYGRSIIMAEQATGAPVEYVTMPDGKTIPRITVNPIKKP